MVSELVLSTQHEQPARTKRLLTTINIERITAVGTKKKSHGQRVRELGVFMRADFGKGRHGHMVYLSGMKDAGLIATVLLIATDDNKYRIRVELPDWIKKGLEELGYHEAEDGRKRRKQRNTFGMLTATVPVSNESLGHQRPRVPSALVKSPRS